jgi:hypothetical protein
MVCFGAVAAGFGWSTVVVDMNTCYAGELKIPWLYPADWRHNPSKGLGTLGTPATLWLHLLSHLRPLTPAKCSSVFVVGSFSS